MEIVPIPCASILRTTRASHLPYNAKSEKNIEIVLDIQGDEPLISPLHIDEVIHFHKRRSPYR